MSSFSVRAGLLAAAFSGLSVLTVGCGPNAGGGGPAADKGGKKDKPAEAANAGGTTHSGWWCDEHGIPEDECSMCSAKVAKEFKAKGDWCDKHDRAKSQCFICDPSLKDKYAAKYRAKYGKEPPEPVGQKDEKGDAGKKDEKK